MAEYYLLNISGEVGDFIKADQFTEFKDLVSRMKELFKESKLKGEELKLLVQLFKGGKLDLAQVRIEPIWLCDLKEVASLVYKHNVDEIKKMQTSDLDMFVANTYAWDGRELPPLEQVQSALTEVKQLLFSND